MTNQELYTKINAILDEYNDSVFIASEVGQLIGDGEKPGLVIRVLLESLRIRRLRRTAKRENYFAKRDINDADLLENLLLN